MRVRGLRRRHEGSGADDVVPLFRLEAQMKKHLKKLYDDLQVRQAVLLLVCATDPRKQIGMNEGGQIGRVLNRG
jgi:hypothetical protein